MKTASSIRRLVIALGCLVGLASVSVHASELNPQPRADAPAAALPVTTSFAKAEGEKGPYVLSIKNTSAAALKVSVAVVESVKSHAKPSDRKHDYTIDAGKSAAVEGLAAHDKVTISAAGHAPLELTVP